METTTARRIEFNEPNTIGLDPALWHTRKLSRFLEVLPYWGGVASLMTFLVWVMVQLTVLGVALAALAALLIFAVTSYIPYFVTKRNEKEQLRYRASHISDLVLLLKSKGLTPDNDDLNALTSTTQSGFKAKTGNGLLYRTDYLWVTEDRIKASFLISDPVARKALDRQDKEHRVEGRILMLVEKHVKANGDFASPEHREAFIAGARAAFDW